MQNKLTEVLEKEFADDINIINNKVNETTIEVTSEHLIKLCEFLKQNENCLFEQLIDLCGVDYLHYGVDEWKTGTATSTGYSRAVKYTPTVADDALNDNKLTSQRQVYRFAVVYHLLSIKHNQRVRVRAFPVGYPPIIESVTNIWNSANWYEREAFDLFGILFNNHPDLRRILTDYGFIGHPFRKDFPLSGKTAVKYDEKLKRVVYVPLEIEPRVLTPKVIRDDQRYASEEK